MKITRRQALAMSAAGAAAAFAPRIAFAEDGDTINLAMISPLTGSYAFTGQRELAGWTDAANYVNANGGFAGKQIKVLPLDSEYKVDVGVAQWKKAIAAGPVHFAKADSIPLARAMVPENTDNYKMLLSTTANGSHMTEADGFQYFFIPGPTYSDLTGIALAYIDKIAGPGTHPKIAFVHSNIEFGRDPVPATLAKAKALGMDLVLEDETAMSGVDVTASAIKLRKAAPDFILFHGYAGNVWPDVLKLARDYQVEATAMGTIWSVDPDTVKGIGPAADGFLGIVPHTLLLEGSTQPVIQEVAKAVKARQGADYGGYGGIGYMSGWAYVTLLREIFSRAIKDGSALDGPTLYSKYAETLERLGFRRRLGRSGVDGQPAHPARQHLQVQRRRQQGQPRDRRSRRERRVRKMSGPILEISDLAVTYAGGITGLDGLSFDVPEGGVVSLLGSNGAGKTTTLKTITNLLPFEGGKIVRGSIRFRGKSIVGISTHKLARMGIVHVREGRRVFAGLTVQENLVAATFSLDGRMERRLKERSDEVYAMFPNLARRRDIQAGYLSGGEQQMLALGRALVAHPELMLIDEASLGLAPVIAEEIFQKVAQINRDLSITVLLVEQNATLGLRYSDYGHVLENGRAVVSGTAAELIASPVVIERYLGGAAA